MRADLRSPPPVAGVVLCGGRSKRMGREKALIPCFGKPLVQWVAGRLAWAADPVFIASGEPGRLGELGYSEVPDERPDSGPLAGLIAGLRASPHDLVAAVAVDMPLMSPALLRLMAGLRSDEDAVVPIGRDGPEPLHALYAQQVLPTLVSALGEGRLELRGSLAELRVREVEEKEWREADPSGLFALNLNRPEDLAMFG